MTKLIPTCLAALLFASLSGCAQDGMMKQDPMKGGWR